MAEEVWELTGLSEPVQELYTPASGALLARTTGGLWRSDDGGTSWAPVPLPPPPPDPQQRIVEVDPTNHDVLYAGGAAGLYRSPDRGAHWSLILPTDRDVEAVAVSPADPRLVYVGLKRFSQFWFLRSRDAGATWEELEDTYRSLCTWAVPILESHPSDVNRLFRTAGCYAGRNTWDELAESRNQGATWTPRFGSGQVEDPQHAFPDILVGGHGAAPERYYLAAQRHRLLGDSSLFRSDDDAASWVEVLAFRSGGSNDQPDVPNVRIGGLAHDPAQPDHAYVALNRTSGPAWDQTWLGSQVLLSEDSGGMWSALGQQDLGRVADLALGIDARYLYAATDHGLWRLPVAPSPQPPGSCAFILGFQFLRDRIVEAEGDIIGQCLENEWHNPENGDGLQRTSGRGDATGMFAWRKADNWTAYTDGYTTWLWGPCGLQQRLNEGPFFAWEGTLGAPCS